MESLIISLIIGFLTIIIVTPYFKRFLEKIGVIGIDMQKKNKPKIATSGGLPLTVGFLGSILTYVFLTTFLTKASTNLTLLFASTTSIMIIALLGFLDDINIQTFKNSKRKEKDIRVGLKQWQKALIPLFAAVPLMTIQAGFSTVSIPFVGVINLGLIYPLIIIPLIIGFTSNAANMLAGMNGLETGLGIILLTSTGLYSLFYGTIEGAIIALSLSACLLAFLKFNKYPAKFLPGDSLTYLIGAVFGASIVIGNIEKFAIIAFIPWFIEFLMKARGKFKVSSLGELQKNGSLKPKYKKIFSWTHISMRLVRKEEYIAPLMMSVETGFCLLAFIIARITV